MIKHRIGSLHTENDESYIQTEIAQSGCAIYGPYELYQPGRYSVTYNIMPNDSDVPEISNGLCGWAEVVGFEKKPIVLEKVDLYGDRLIAQNGRIDIHFTLDKAMKLEFRVFSSGKIRLKVSTARNVLPVSGNGYILNHSSDSEISNEFFKSNFSRFRVMHENGVQLRANDNGIMATYGEISFYIRSTDSFQLVNEIFFGNTYNFSLRQNVLAIDVGMNIGLASLYMARGPRVIEVHAFEPFRNPFDRALENFALNPDLSRKITPTNIGLGGVNEELDVMSEGERTIGISIHGLKSGGSPERIVVRDAAEIFDQLIRKAKSNGWGVIAKIDCEGSEFPIFTSLIKAGMLTDICGIMMEWHKKGSPDASNKNLLGPLIENNFVIFDRTNPKYNSGMLYAVRTA